MKNNSRIELSRKALKNNIDFIRSLIKPEVTLSCVVKGNAYGHGIAQMVPALESLGVRHFSVFSFDEARKVLSSKSHEDTVILIMGFIPDTELEWMISHDIECFVFNLSRLRKLVELTEKLQKPVKVHIEIETGMNRTGIPERLWSECIEILKNNKDSIIFQGLCTHFAGAESISNYKRIKDQRKQFKHGLDFFIKHFKRPIQVHNSCSAASIVYPKENWDMVRIGILQYGLWPSREIYISYLTKNKLSTDPLKRLISWKSEVMDIKEVEADQFIGYGTSLLTEKKMKIAAIPVGYGHGYSRSLSNQGKVIIRGCRLDVIGIVNMNMLLVDVSNLSQLHVGDEVILIGSDKGIEISIASFSDLSSQLNYEMLTRIDKDIPRSFVED